MTVSENLLDQILGLTTANANGWPDRAILLNGQIVAFEYKRGRDRLSHAQRKRLKEIVEAGGKAYVVRIQEVLSSGKLISAASSDILLPKLSPKGTGNRLSEDIHKEIQRRVRAGETVRKIARELVISKGTVAYWAGKTKLISR